MARGAWLVSVIAACAAAGCTAVLTYPNGTTERCFNGQDDDFDGLIDARDPDCPPLGAACVPGDGTCERTVLVCAAIASVGSICVPSCTSAEMCPPGWSCGGGTCACTPCAERCNGIDDDCDTRVDESTCAVGEACMNGACRCTGRELVVPSTLDLLFVIDDSRSMTDRLITLHDALPAAVQALSTGDLDGDGVQDVAPVSSLHVAVVTTDLGVGADLAVPGCSRNGDDGILSNGTECEGMRVFYFETFRDAPMMLARNVTCALSVPAVGCGFSQPLDAALLALSTSTPTAGTRPGYVAPTFHDGTHGQGDSATNELFLRPDSTLAVVLVTDSDDCSASDIGLYSPDDPLYRDVHLNLRCSTFPDALESIATAVDHLLSLRRDPGHVFFAAIAGIPSGAGSMTPAEILALPAMQIGPDPSHPNRLMPACSYLTHDMPGMPSMPAGAEPARRLVEAARAVECQGGNFALASICDDDYDAAFRDILRAVASADDRRVCIHDAP